MGKPYNRNPKNILENFSEEPLIRFFILYRKGGGVVRNRDSSGE